MLRSNGTGPIFFTEFVRSGVPFCSHNPIIVTVQNFRRLAVQSLPVNTAKISRLFTVLFFFRIKIAEIERFTLRAAILHECQNYLGDEGRFGMMDENGDSKAI